MSKNKVSNINKKKNIMIAFHKISEEFITSKVRKINPRENTPAINQILFS
jgi:hypothetical protein